MNYVILSDSTIDITNKMAKEIDIDTLSLKFTIEGKTYDGNMEKANYPIKTFYEKLRTGIPSTTSQINTGEFTDFFEEYLQKGQDILYIGFSSGLSGTVQSATIAQKELAEKYPERKIKVIDTLCASMGEGLLVYLAAKKRLDGEGIEEVASWLESNKLKLCHWFTVDDLHHLKRGGRVSAATAVVGTVLGIKPILHVDDEGHLIAMSKVRGRKQSLDTLVNKIEETGINPSEQIMFISHGDCYDDAVYVRNEIQKKYKTKKIEINFIGPVVGAHAGPGTVALFFLGTKR